MNKEFYDKYALLKLIFILIFGLSNIFIPFLIIPIFYPSGWFSLIYFITSYVIFFILIMFFINLKVEVSDDKLIFRKVGFLKIFKIDKVKKIIVYKKYLHVIGDDIDYNFKIILPKKGDFIDYFNSRNIPVFDKTEIIKNFK